jgi:DNA-binding response OmpR family regulator
MVKKHILMVDDEPNVCYTIKNGLELLDESLEVNTVHDGLSCFKELERGKPDLILLDINIPEMSGWLIYDKIRDNAQWTKIPIIFLTARTDQISKKVGGFMAEDFIEKPVDIRELKKRIDIFINTKR